MQASCNWPKKLLCRVTFAALAIVTLGVWVHNISPGSFASYFSLESFSQSFDACRNAGFLRNEHEAAGIAKKYLFEKNTGTKITAITLKDSRRFVPDDSGPLRWELELQLLYSERNAAGNQYSMSRTPVFVTVDDCGRVLREEKSSAGQ
jgi:hypothetical protein